ncbi:hypothetical protein MRB53_007794 [Persea americana]|uniref:Uncharacterized protein n=1 Tax=Persea americana TaxID=3435 RepID=A0ACC2MJW5_PERAE|nr:hypothetical protein MRB53_007794 [Persea americana]
MKSNHNSSQEDDVVGLALIIVEAAIHSANLTHSQLGSLKNGTTDENFYEVIELCEGLYGSVAGAGAFLHLAASRLRHHTDKEYRLAYNDLNITKEYAGWCHEEFLNYDVFYPPLLANREQNLVQICEIALSVISRLL